jgi:DNA-binding protein
MKNILVTMDKSAEEFVSEAKKILEEAKEVEITGKSRDTVKAVDVAEMLKLHGAKEEEIIIQTEEAEIEGKKVRVSKISIKLKH